MGTIDFPDYRREHSPCTGREGFAGAPSIQTAIGGGMSIQRREAGIGGWVAAALLCVAQASCDQLSPRMVMRPVVRFVDEVEQERIVSRCDDEVQDRGVFARGEEARTTVADDVRGTLSPPKSRPLLYIEDLAVPASRELEFDQEVNGALSAAKQLLLEIMIKRNGSWVKLPSQTAAIRWDGTKPRASLRIQLPPEMQEGEPTGVRVLAYARMCAGWRSHETAAKRIPAGAVLEFGIGLAEPGRFGESADRVSGSRFGRITGRGEYKADRRIGVESHRGFREASGGALFEDVYDICGNPGENRLRFRVAQLLML